MHNDPEYFIQDAHSALYQDWDGGYIAVVVHDVVHTYYCCSVESALAWMTSTSLPLRDWVREYCHQGEDAPLVEQAA